MNIYELQLERLISRRWRDRLVACLQTVRSRVRVRCGINLFYKSLTHRNAQEVRVFTLLILLSPLCTFYDSFLIYFAANIYISVKCTGSSKKYAVNFFSVRYILFKANMHIICTFIFSCVLRWNEHVLNNYCQHTVKKILVIFKVNIKKKIY